MDKDLYENGQKLPLFEEFYTIQGEGFHTGKAAYFVRLGGCDLACNWCDSKRSWRAGIDQLVDVQDIADKIRQLPAKAVVVTGGEPLSYPLDYLCAALKEAGIQTFLETSGAYPLSGYWDWVCLSPKKQRPPVDSNFQYANELKVIIASERDFAWAELNAARVSDDCKLYLQAEWSKADIIVPMIVEYVKQNPKWNISVQVHKFIKIP